MTDNLNESKSLQETIANASSKHTIQAVADALTGNLLKAGKENTTTLPNKIREMNTSIKAPLIMYAANQGMAGITKALDADSDATEVAKHGAIAVATIAGVGLLNTISRALVHKSLERQVTYDPLEQHRQEMRVALDTALGKADFTIGHKECIDAATLLRSGGVTGQACMGVGLEESHGIPKSLKAVQVGVTANFKF